jgi:FkbM family methyltransferase
MKKLIKKMVRSVGLDLHRLSVVSNPSFQLLKALQRYGVSLVFDIGANTGQFAGELRSVGFGGRIVSFEPLPDAYQVLATNAASDSFWHVHSRSAVGDVDGKIDINIASNSVSSSVLPMLEAHSLAAKGSAYLGKVNTPIVRLDTVAGQYLEDIDCYFIKIDTQGFEWQVLDGARETLKNAQGVLCELSLVPLYEGQRLWLEIIDRLKSEGFTLWSIQQGFTDPRDGRTLQVDAIFFRT